VEHLHHFRLPQDPFINEPDLRFYFESASHRDAQRRVERGLRQRKGLTLMTGDGGMGKTLLARRILESLEEDVFEATLLVMLPGAADATGILQRFARQLGCDEPAADRGGLLAQIYEQLAIVREDGRHAVLMIDDAQVMTPEVFAELSGLLNLEYEDRRLVSMLFVGSPELDQLVQNDASIMPRVDVRVRLQSLDMTNTTAYLTHRLSVAKGNPNIVPNSAIESLFKFGRGRPRLLNTLADNALFEAYLAGRPAIDPSDVERAASDLGVGPDPGSTYTTGSPAMTKAADVTARPMMDQSVSIKPSLDWPRVSNAFDEALDLDEPVAELELGSEIDAAEARVTAPAAIDLDEGLEAALEDFDSASTLELGTGPEMFGDDSLSLVFGIDPLSLSQGDGNPPLLDPLESQPFLIATPLEAKAVNVPSEAEPFGLSEAELFPLITGEIDELEDAFVELLDE
jgi:general secretion pathway protein A